MREKMTPQQMSKWKAFRRLQPDPIERIAVILKFGFCAVVNALGAKLEPDNFEPAEAKRFTQAESEVSPNQAANIAATMLGRPNG